MPQLNKYELIILSRDSDEPTIPSDYENYQNDHTFNFTHLMVMNNLLDYRWEGKRDNNFSLILDNRDNGYDDDHIPNGPITVKLTITNVDSEWTHNFGMSVVKYGIGFLIFVLSIQLFFAGIDIARENRMARVTRPSPASSLITSPHHSDAEKIQEDQFIDANNINEDSESSDDARQ